MSFGYIAHGVQKNRMIFFRIGAGRGQDEVFIRIQKKERWDGTCSVFDYMLKSGVGNEFFLDLFHLFEELFFSSA